MSLVLVSDYRSVMNDDATDDATIQKALNRAEDRVSEYLLRPLPQATYTENLRPSQYGVVHPTATPVASVSSPAGATVLDDVAVSIGLPGWDMIVEHSWYADWTSRRIWRSAITYVGGWTNNVAQATDMPETVMEAVCTLANRLTVMVLVTSSIPVGALNVKLGDAAITFDKPYGSGGTIESIVPGITSVLKPWRYKY